MELLVAGRLQSSSGQLQWHLWCRWMYAGIDRLQPTSMALPSSGSAKTNLTQKKTERRNRWMLAGQSFPLSCVADETQNSYIAEASQHPGNRVLGSIDTRNEVHAGTDPVERPHDWELHTVLSSLGCSSNMITYSRNKKLGNTRQLH